MAAIAYWDDDVPRCPRCGEEAAPGYRTCGRPSCTTVRSQRRLVLTPRELAALEEVCRRKGQIK
jgi:hypothetical protein